MKFLNKLGRNFFFVQGRQLSSNRDKTLHQFNEKYIKLTIDRKNETHDGKVVLDIYEDVTNAFVKIILSKTSESF